MDLTGNTEDYQDFLFQVAIFSDNSIDKQDLKCYYILENKYELLFSRIGAWIWKSNAIYT